MAGAVLMDTSKYIGNEYSDKNCWQLVQWVYQDEFGIILPDLSTPSEMIGDVFTKIDLGMEQVGDVLVFTTGEMKTHVGVVSDPFAGIMLHSNDGTDCCLARYRAWTWKEKLRSIYRHIALQ